MVTTIELKHAITQEQYNSIVEMLKKMGVLVKEEKKDDTKMSKEEFFAMIDEARKQPTRRTTIEELKSRYL